MTSNEEKAQEPTSVNTGEGIQPQTGNIVDRADLLNKRLEENIKKNEELVTRFENAAAKMMLSGRAEAGTKIKTPEDTAQEMAEATISKWFGKR